MIGTDYLATPEDGKELLRILESSPAKGSIELIYTRRPDAYASYMKEPGEAIVYATRKEDRLVGTQAALIREVYIGGKESKAAYICGLKKDPEYSGTVGFSGGYRKALVREDVDYYFCSVVSDNDKVHQMFQRKNPWMHMTPIQEYITYILTPRFYYKTKATDLCFRQAKEEDKEKILAFLNSEGKKKDLFPVIKNIEDFHGLHIEDFYLLEKTGEILATAALWNQTDYKQYVVKKYRGLMRLARFFNPVLSLLGYLKLPKENKYLEFPMLSFFLCKDDNVEYYKTFLSGVNQEIKKTYDCYVIGMPKNYYGVDLFRKLPSIHFDTVLYSIQFRFQKGNALEPDASNLYPECGLL